MDETRPSALLKRIPEKRYWLDIGGWFRSPEPVQKSADSMFDVRSRLRAEVESAKTGVIKVASRHFGQGAHRLSLCY